ncbi:hypothetical protein B0H19DRAFT_1082449 [Mycena capillaripes]|nr:hypothetical protein B0H19DRAFT_1082449 [Mycena capillaripes]
MIDVDGEEEESPGSDNDDEDSSDDADDNGSDEGEDWDDGEGGSDDDEDTSSLMLGAGGLVNNQREGNVDGDINACRRVRVKPGSDEWDGIGERGRGGRRQLELRSMGTVAWARRGRGARAVCVGSKGDGRDVAGMPWTAPSHVRKQTRRVGREGRAGQRYVTASYAALDGSVYALWGGKLGRKEKAGLWRGMPGPRRGHSKNSRAARVQEGMNTGFSTIFHVQLVKKSIMGRLSWYFVGSGICVWGIDLGGLQGHRPTGKQSFLGESEAGSGWIWLGPEKKGAFCGA